MESPQGETTGEMRKEPEENTTEKATSKDSDTDDNDDDYISEIVTELNYRDHFLHTPKDDVDSFDITSVAVTKEPGQILVCDRGNKSIKLIDNQFNILHRYSVIFEPYDVTVVDEEYAVISFPFVRLLQYIKFKNGSRISPWFPLKSLNEYHGICATKDIIIAICRYDDETGSKVPTIHIIDREGAIQHKLSSLTFVEPSKIDFDDTTKTIVVTDGGRKAIVSMDISGNLLSECLMCNFDPKGLAVDKSSGHIYINNVAQQNVIQLSLDLKKIRTIQAKNDKMNNGLALAYCSRTQKLYVGLHFSPFLRVFSV